MIVVCGHISTARDSAGIGADYSSILFMARSAAAFISGVLVAHS